MSGAFERLAATLAVRAARLAAARVEARRVARRDGSAWRSATRLWPLFAKKD